MNVPFRLSEEIAICMYVGEPRRICGNPVTRADMEEAVYAGYSKCNESRSAHKACWDAEKQKNEWAFPEDDFR